MVAVVSVSVKSEAQGALVSAVADVTADVSDADLRGSKGLVVLLERLADRVLPTSDPLVRARLRGQLAMRQVMNGDGGGLSAREMAELLGISRQAVDKRRKAGQILALALPKRGLLYPAWQVGARTGLLPGLGEVLAALGGADPWACARFFVTGSDRLGGKRPLDLLRRGKLGAVLAAAQQFGAHGAA